MDNILTSILTIIGSVVASGGFWAWISKREYKKDARTKLLLGLCHDRILSLGLTYISRNAGITKDEYINLVEYLSIPYFELGGNGTAFKIIEEIKKLPIVESVPKGL